VEIAEWKKFIRVMLEENAFFDGKEMRYMHGRQKTIYTIPRADGYINQ
jgi:hypothetical protein